MTSFEVNHASLLRKADSRRLWRTSGYAILWGISVLLVFETLITPGALLRAYTCARPAPRTSTVVPQAPSNPLRTTPPRVSIRDESPPYRTPRDIFEAAFRTLDQLPVANEAFRRRIAAILRDADEVLGGISEKNPDVILWNRVRAYQGFDKDKFQFYWGKLVRLQKEGKETLGLSVVEEAESWATQADREIRELDRDLDRVESVVRQARQGDAP